MKRVETNIVVGLALVGMGALFLLQNLGVLGLFQTLVWALLFVGGGVAFLSLFWRARERWWALIPGFTLLSLGVLIGLDGIIPGGAGAWGGALFLGGISLGFWAVYLTDRARWWALIPAGVLLTLALVAGLADRIEGMEVGGLFFLGLACTFLLVYLLPTAGGRMRWALVPASAMLVMALLLTAGSIAAIDLFWPLALILVGLYLAFRSLRLRHIWHAGDSPASER
jgi:hypothetical protein